MFGWTSLVSRMDEISVKISYADAILMHCSMRCSTQLYDPNECPELIASSKYLEQDSLYRLDRAYHFRLVGEFCAKTKRGHL